MNTKTIISIALFISISVSSIAQSLGWVKQMGGISSNIGTSITIDASGNIYTTGYFAGTVDFDPGVGIFNLTAVGMDDIFIQKLDASGNFIWAKHMGGTLNDFGYSVDVDAFGNVYITGSFWGITDFDPGPGTYNLTSEAFDIFVLKLDASGNFNWAKQMGGTDWDIGRSIDVDAFGNVYITGDFEMTVDFDPGPGVFNLTSFGHNDIFVQKLDSSGNFIWAKQMGGTYWDAGNSIAVDASENVHLTGYFSWIADFDPSSTEIFNLTFLGHHDIFVQKLDSSGNFVWAKQMGGTSAEYGVSIAVDVSGNVYTTGYFNGTVDFDPSLTEIFNLTSAGDIDIFIQKLDSLGNFIWVKQMGGKDPDFVNSLAVDDSGNVYTTGYFSGTVDFDPSLTGIYNLTSVGDGDIFVQKLDSSGNFVWAIQMGGAGSGAGYMIALDTYANIFTIGYFKDTIDFDPGPATYNFISAGYNDIFIQKLRQCIVDTAVTQTGTTLTANATSATYQWLDCNKGYSIITGETNHVFNVDTSGNYAVEVTQNSCVGISNCYDVTVVGIITNSFPGEISLYPNPNDGNFTLDLGANYPKISIEITDITGKQVYSKKFNNSKLIELKLKEPAGIYFLSVFSNGNKATFKLLKE